MPSKKLKQEVKQEEIEILDIKRQQSVITVSDDAFANDDFGSGTSFASDGGIHAMRKAVSTVGNWHACCSSSKMVVAFFQFLK